MNCAFAIKFVISSGETHYFSSDVDVVEFTHGDTLTLKADLSILFTCPSMLTSRDSTQYQPG
jgi:hypothetical protein